jgi:DNA-binding MarR family transcriptional regulator
MEKLLEGLFDGKLLTITKFFLQNKGKEFYLKEIATATSVPIATVFRAIKKLKQMGVIDEVKIKYFKMYKCAGNERVSFLESILKDSKRHIENFANLCSQIANVEEILIYGKELEDKANMIIIGKSIDSNEIKKICSEFKEKHNFTITPLILEKEQYEQITAMGLYSEKKKALFKREIKTQTL